MSAYFIQINDEPRAHWSGPLPCESTARLVVELSRRIGVRARAWRVDDDGGLPQEVRTKDGGAQ